MLRAPTCITSTYGIMISTCDGSITSLTTSRPLSSAARRSNSGPFSPSPWNEYGDERGLNAPPRSNFAPACATRAAIELICAADSTAHGPAATATDVPPTITPLPRSTIEPSGWKWREASLNGCATRTMSSTPGAASSASSSLRCSLLLPTMPITVRAPCVSRYSLVCFRAENFGRYVRTQNPQIHAQLLQFGNRCFYFRIERRGLQIQIETVFPRAPGDWPALDFH